MKIASIVGNRPQFIKAAPTSVALRERGLEEVVIHTGQHYDRELSQVFYDELGLEEPRYRLDLRTADPQLMRARDRRPPRGRAARLGARLRRHELDAGRRGGRDRARNRARPRRGGPAQRRPLDAGRTEQDRGRQAGAAALLPGRALAGDAGRRGRPGPGRGRGRRHGRRDAALRADRPRAGGPSGPSRTRCSRFTERRTRSPSGCAACSRRPARAAGTSSSPCIPGRAR